MVGVFDPTVEDPWPPVDQELEYLTRLFSDPVGTLEGCPTRRSASDYGAFSIRAGPARRWHSTMRRFPSMRAFACVHQIRNL